VHRTGPIVALALVERIGSVKSGKPLGVYVAEPKSSLPSSARAASNCLAT
jgi:hypothetical protein